MNRLEIKDLSFNLENIKFDKFNLTIKENSFITILGKSNSGKTTLANIICGNYEYEGKILYNEQELNKKNIKKFIGFVPSNPKEILVKNSVIENLKYYYNNSYNELDDFNLNLNNLNNLIDINNIINSKVNMLSGGELQLAAIASQLIKNPDLLILDEAFSLIDENIKTDILKKLKKSKTTIINITKDSDQALFSKTILVLDKGKIIEHNNYKKILENEKILKNNNIKIPFLIDLSMKLKYYNTVDKIYYSISKLVNNIWK